MSEHASPFDPFDLLVRQLVKVTFRALRTQFATGLTFTARSQLRVTGKKEKVDLRPAEIAVVNVTRTGRSAVKSALLQKQFGGKSVKKANMQ
jgi:hypothetical protein